MMVEAWGGEVEEGPTKHTGIEKAISSHQSYFIKGRLLLYIIVYQYFPFSVFKHNGLVKVQTYKTSSVCVCVCVCVFECLCLRMFVCVWQMALCILFALK